MTTATLIFVLKYKSDHIISYVLFLCLECLFSLFRPDAEAPKHQAVENARQTVPTALPYT